MSRFEKGTSHLADKSDHVFKNKHIGAAVKLVGDPDVITNYSLMDCTYSNTERFNFNGREFEAKCVKVYDGDTITAVFMVSGKYYRFSIRMDGYDAPEIKSKNPDAKKKETEKIYARASRDYLSNIIMDKIILLKCKDYDMYGRILADVEFDGKNINSMMLKNGYCRPYSGGHKEEWDFSKFRPLDSLGLQHS